MQRIEDEKTEDLMQMLLTGLPPTLIWSVLAVWMGPLICEGEYEQADDRINNAIRQELRRRNA